MNCLKYCLTLIIFSFSIFCNAQKVDSVGISKVSSNIKLSYNSSFIYPGASIGIELPLKTKALSKTSKSGILKNFTKDYFLITNLSWYHQPAFHDNLYLTAGWMKRKTKNKRIFY